MPEITNIDDAFRPYQESTEPVEETTDNTNMILSDPIGTDEPVQETEEQITDEVIEKEWNFPDWIDDELKPKQFKSQKEELAFYRNNYPNLIEQTKNEKFIKHFADEYQDHLIAREKNVEELKVVTEALKGQNGKTLAKLFFNDALVKEGYNTKIDTREAREFIEQELAAKYGADWQSKYDPEDELDASTLSGKIFRERTKLINAFSEHNNKVQPIQDTVTDEQRQAIIDKDYEEHFKPYNMSKEDYDAYVSQAREYLPKMNMMDLYKTMNFDAFVEDAYNKGIEEGKKSVTKEIERAGGKPMTNYYSKDVEEKVADKKFSLEDLYSVSAKGRM